MRTNPFHGLLRRFSSVLHFPRDERSGGASSFLTIFTFNGQPELDAFCRAGNPASAACFAASPSPRGRKGEQKARAIAHSQLLRFRVLWGPSHSHCPASDHDIAAVSCSARQAVGGTGARRPGRRARPHAEDAQPGLSNCARIYEEMEGEGPLGSGLVWPAKQRYAQVGGEGSRSWAPFLIAAFGMRCGRVAAMASSS